MIEMYVELTPAQVDAEIIPASEPVDIDAREHFIKGDTGERGERGERGEKGEPFRYEDFTLEQLASLKGEKGDAGRDGRDGVDGRDGRDGNNYVITQADYQKIAKEVHIDSITDKQVWMDTENFTGYTLNEAVDATLDYIESVEGMIPSDSHINALIDAKIGVIENGTY